MKLGSLSIALVSMIVLAGAAGTGHADDRDKADALFKQGKKLMADKRYADACEAFEKSQKLDPAIGTLVNAGRCYEEWGKLGRAYLAYEAAARMAKEAKDDREPRIRELLEQLAPNVPHLTIKVPKDAPADLEVTLDSRKLATFNEPFVVDPGPHTIEWRVKGGAKKTKVVPIDRGGDSEITLDMTMSGEAGSSTGAARGGGEPQPRRDEPPTRPGRRQRMAGIALGSVGVIGLGVASYMTLAARSDYNGALDAHCGGMKNNCDMTGLEITRDARSTANKATIVFLVGAAMIGGGAALYFLAPDGPAPAAESTPAQQSFYLAPTVSPDGVGVVLGGSL